MLMTFALGLAGVFAFHNTLKFSNKIYVDTPQTETGDVLVVFPRCLFEMPFAGGSGGGAVTRLVSSEGTPIIEKRIYKEPERLTKCVENQNSIQK
jgi:hypothetical protein